jgi:hypothetical protein
MFLAYLVRMFEVTFSQKNKLLAIQCILKVVGSFQGGPLDEQTLALLKVASLTFCFIPDTD